MGLQETYIVVAAMFFTTYSTEAATIQANVDVGGTNSELLDMIFKQIEMLGHRKENESTSLSQDHTELASALLQAAPVVIIKGNITDAQRRMTITFTVQASHFPPPNSDLEDDDDDDDDGGDEYEWDRYDWRGSGGVFHPIVGVVEPYVLSLAELVFNSIISTVISNFLEGVTMIGDIRLV